MGLRGGLLWTHGIAFIPWFPTGSGQSCREVLTGLRGTPCEPSKMRGLASASSPIMAAPSRDFRVDTQQKIVLLAASLLLPDEDYQALSRVPALAASR